jgi:hypothetical protein
MKRFLRDNSLTLALAALFLFCLIMQAVTGMAEHNDDLQRHGLATLSMGEYLLSGHFIEATFENWESEFFQMGLYVLLTALLFQRGSSESNPLPDEEENPLKKKIAELQEQLKQEEIQRLGVPWAVKKGGVWKVLYQRSLSLALLTLFVISWALHALGGWKQDNLVRSFHNKPPESLLEFIGSSDFWFQSFQNWQSEFFSVASLGVLSIFLRQKGSPQSKKMRDPNWKTGSD